MIVLFASLLVLWLLLSRSNIRLFADAHVTNRLIKSGAGLFIVLSAVVVFLRGHLEVALLLLGSGLYLFNLANKSPAARRGAKRSEPPRASRVRSATIEMDVDSATGVMRGVVLAGPHEGLRLEQMTRSQCEAVHALCVTADAEGARLLEAYLDRRFPGWRLAGQGDGDARRDRARRAGGMSEEEAYQVLGLPRGAPRDDVVRSHRSLMKKLHPDQGGSTSLAARVNEAKEVLTRRHT